MPYTDKAVRAAHLVAKRIADPDWHERNKARWRAYHYKNKDRQVAKVADWRRSNPGTRSAEHRKRRYELNREDYDRLVAQQRNLCMICQQPPSGKPPMGVLHVDHDHATGKVRGLLCGLCNRGIGALGDDIARIESALKYLKGGCRGII